MGPRRRCGRWLSTGGPVDRYRYRGGSPERSVIAPSRVSSVWGLSPCTLLGKHPCDRKLFCSVTLQIKYEFFPTQLAPIASRRPSSRLSHPPLRHLYFSISRLQVATFCQSPPRASQPGLRAGSLHLRRFLPLHEKLEPRSEAHHVVARCAIHGLALACRDSSR